MKHRMHTESTPGHCICKDPTVLIIDRRVVSRTLALLMLVGFVIFVAGYFLGKKNASEKMLCKIEQEAFSDHVQLALATFFDPAKLQTNDVSDESSEPIISTQEAMNVIDQQQPTIEPVQQEVMQTAKYQAQLLGGSSKMVRSFADRLAKRGITVEVKRRVSKTARGKNIIWYQAVTPIFDKKEDMDTVIASIQKTEKITDIKIIEIV